MRFVGQIVSKYVQLLLAKQERYEVRRDRKHGCLSCAIQIVIAGSTLKASLPQTEKIVKAVEDLQPRRGTQAKRVVGLIDDTTFGLAEVLPVVASASGVCLKIRQKGLPSLTNADVS